MPSSRRSSQPRKKPRSPALQAYFLTSEPPGKPKNTGVGNLSLLQGIFLTQEMNQDLLHCRQILYQLSYQEKPAAAATAKSLQSCPTLCDPIDGSPPGSPVPGILQARILEWYLFPSPGDLPNPGIKSRSPHCRWILYQLSHRGSPRILEWVTYPFSRGSSQPRN